MIFRRRYYILIFTDFIIYHLNFITFLHKIKFISPQSNVNFPLKSEPKKQIKLKPIQHDKMAKLNKMTYFKYNTLTVSTNN